MQVAESEEHTVLEQGVSHHAELRSQAVGQAKRAGLCVMAAGDLVAIAELVPNETVKNLMYLGAVGIGALGVGGYGIDALDLNSIARSQRARD